MSRQLSQRPPQQAPGGYRIAELLVSSPLAASLDTDAPVAMTITPGEKMHLHLKRLVTYFGINAVTSIYPQLDLNNYVGVTVLDVYGGGVPLIRGGGAGTGAPNPPMSTSPLRDRMAWVDLGWWNLSSQDTVDATVEVQGTAIAGDASMACPCLPANPRLCLDLDPKRMGPSLVAGSGLEDSLAAGGHADLDFNASEDGIIDLTGLFVMGLGDSNIEADGQLHIDALPSSTMTAFLLPGTQPLLLGTNDPEAPLAIFSQRRRWNWVDFGMYRIGSGQQVRISIANNGADAASYSWGAPWWPISDLRARGVQLPDSCK